MSNRSRVGRALFWAVASLLCLPALALAASPQYIPGQIIVKFKATARTTDRVTLRASVGGPRLKDLQIINGELVKVQGMTVEQAIALAKTNPHVVYAEPDWEIKLDAQPRRKEQIDLVPNDTRFAELWGMQNTGQTGGTAGADISATNAWDLFTGSSSVLVGVIDTGIDYTHPDIAGNAWTNPGEIAGNSIDDDMNGFVDDVHGYDFVNNDGDPFDDNNHGTHCSGTIGGVGNNGLGVAGVNWDVSIAGIKFLSAGGSGSTANAILSVQYAVTIGCDLTSNSWGGGAESLPLLDAINAAGAAGQLFIAAAGNSGVNMDVSPSYPAAYNSPYIIAVAATDHNDALASFSNFGLTTCDLGAPGVDILSSIPGASYALFDGTSMACPHVAGAAALIKGRFPGMTNTLIKQRIMDFADPIPALAGRCVTGARLNVFMAIADPDSIAPGSIDDLATPDVGSSHIGLSWTATGDDGETGRCSVYEMRYATFPLDAMNFGTGTLITPSPNPQTAGSAESKEVGGLAFSTTYYFAIIAKDEFGNPGGLSNVASATTLDAPDIMATETSMSASLLTGATDTQVLQIGNEGPGTLDFTVPTPALDFLRFAPPAVAQKTFPPMELGKNEFDPRAGDPVIAASGGPDAFGYRWIDSDEVGGPAFSWVDITGVGTPIPFISDDANQGPFPIGFNFDFYGNTFNSVRVCTNGWLSFTSTLIQYANQPLPAAGTTNPENLVAPFWDDLTFAAAGDAYYYNDGTRFIVSWVNVPHFSAGGPYSFQAILYPTGEVRYQYLSVTSPDNSATVGIQNATRDVGLQTAFNATYVHNNLAVRYIPLAQWLSVTPTSGRLASGERMDLDVTFDATGMTGGTYTGTIHVVSNDPDENPKDVAATLIVTGAPNIVASASLAYGTVFLGQTPSLNISVSNTGTDNLNVTSVVCSDGALSAVPSNFVLAPSASQVVVVTYAPASEAPLAATVTVNSDDPDQGSIVFNATGNALVGPELSVQPTSLGAYMQPSEVHQTTLRITNGNLSGQASLDYTVGASVGKASALGTIPSHPSMDLGKNEVDPRRGEPQIAAQGGPDAFGYRWKDSNEPGGPVFNWVDITGVGTAIPFTGDDVNLGPFPIGFNFTFYGNTYNSVRVCTNGWLSFTNSTAVTYVNTALPAASPNPENLIAPLWDDLIFTVSGDAYYYNDGSRFIVSWVNVPHYTGAGAQPGPYTFQAILYPSGKIVYQYLAINPPVDSNTIGIQNQARTIGLQTVFNAAYVTNGMAIQIQKTPEWLSVSPPAGSIAGAGVLDLTVTFNSTDLVPGTYLGNLHVTSNDPDEASQDVPVTLVVGGATDVAALPREFGLAMTSGNPTRSMAQFTVALPAKGDVDVYVYDARGKQVRGLARGTRDAGFHPITWNGLDDRGLAVASGVYYVRMRAAGTPDKTVRVTLLH